MQVKKIKVQLLTIKNYLKKEQMQLKDLLVENGIESSRIQAIGKRI
ncbi:MAG: hypothetical protein R2837_08230 [Aliarcobacter sp.]